MRIRLFDQLENSMERLVEGSSGRLFRNSVQPAEIARKLERAMVANQWISVNGRLAPNSYQVALNEIDFARFAASVDTLSQQMSDWLGEVATKRGFSTIGGLHVSIVPASNVPAKSIVVTTSHTETVADGSLASRQVQETVQFSPLRVETLRPSMSLRVAYNDLEIVEHPIRKTLTIAGRALENDIVLQHRDVSRYHARLELGIGAVTLTDLGSTNGTWINGYLCEGATQLFEGDAVAFGTLHCTIITGSG